MNNARAIPCQVLFFQARKKLHVSIWTIKSFADKFKSCDTGRYELALLRPLDCCHFYGTEINCNEIAWNNENVKAQSKISINEIFYVQIELVSAVDMRSETVFCDVRHEI